MRNKNQARIYRLKEKKQARITRITRVYRDMLETSYYLEKKIRVIREIRA